MNTENQFSPDSLIGLFISLPYKPHYVYTSEYAYDRKSKKKFLDCFFCWSQPCLFCTGFHKKTTALADSAKKKTNSLIISFELRQRAEYRHGYRNIATHDTGAAFFVAQRARLNIAYSGNKFDLFASLQDARVWGQQDPRNPTQPLYLFEVYAEPHFTNKFSVRAWQATHRLRQSAHVL